MAELPYLMTHASIEEEERVSLGVTNNLIRISVGLENPQDIIEDIDAALKAACQVVESGSLVFWASDILRSTLSEQNIKVIF